MTVVEAIKALETIEEDYPNWVEDMTIRMGELEEGVGQIAKEVDGIDRLIPLTNLELERILI